MPLVKPKNKEKKTDFVSRCIGDTQTNKDFPDQKQRIAVCYSQWDKAKKDASASVELNDDEFLVFAESECPECDETIEATEEMLTLENLHIPTSEEYLSAEEIDLDTRAENCDLIFTGEGFLDAQSFEGKVVGSMYDLAHSKKKQLCAIVGDADTIVDPPFSVMNLVQLFGSDTAMNRTLFSIEQAALGYLKQVN